MWKENNLRIFGSFVRCLFALLLVLTSFYSVLAYIPDTYIAFVKAPFMAWLPALIHFQPYISAILVTALTYSMWRERSQDRAARRMLWGFIFAGLIVSLYFLAQNPYSKLRNDSHSFVLGIATIFPLMWAGAIDCQSCWRRRDWTFPIRPRFGVALLLVFALSVAVAYPATAYLRYLVGGMAPPMGRVDLLAWTAAVLTHVVVFGFILGLLAFCESLASVTPCPLKTRFLSFAAVAWLTIAVVMDRVVFGAIPFHGTESLIYSGVFGLAWAFFGAGLVLRAATHPRAAVQPGSHARYRTETVLLFMVLMGAACVVPAIIGLIDWNSLVEKTWVLFFWAGLLSVLFRWMPRPSRVLRPALAVIFPIVAYGAATLGMQFHPWGSSTSPLSQAINIHSSYDVSYGVALDLLKTSAIRPCDEQCRYVHEQTNIPPAMLPPTPELDLVENMQRTKEKRPNIFVFVVDSLRQDFVTPYNPAVDYTPEMDRFAKDSLVFHNAFSRYAGTTLSEPAIWAGSMLLHTHFVQPFSRVNNLEKLVVTDGYQEFVTVDTTLQSLLDTNTNLVPLDDNGSKWTDVDLCSTVPDAEAKISQRPAGSPPIFMFTQPQNVHLLTVAKRHADLLLNTRDRLAAAYAQDLRRMDGCFGRFVRFLKSKNLYDDSIIVVTADHGEFGHGSHAASIEPDILKVPLIMHVPETIRHTYYYDTSRVIFTTDITPTLYYLLGHRLIRNDEVMGRPMITKTRDESLGYERPSYLMASSYVPNYGILSDNGRTLFSFDDYQNAEALYNLAADPHGEHNLITSQIAQSDHQEIRGHLAKIAEAYNFHYARSTLIGWLLH